MNQIRIACSKAKDGTLNEMEAMEGRSVKWGDVSIRRVF